MNEKLINSLMWKAGAKFEMFNWVHYDDFSYEKFAQLIVEECLSCCEDERDLSAIKEHFGVK